MKRLRAIRYSLLLIGLISAFLFLSTVISFAREPIRIGGTLGLTGKYADFADMQLKGFRLWERDVNKRGGILGRPVKVVIYDDESSAQKAKQLYDKLIHQEKVDFLFAPFSSEITLKVLPLTEAHHYPLIISGASSDQLWEQNYTYVFGLFLPASRMTSGFLEMLLMNDIDDIAIVYSTDPFSTSVGEGTRKWAGVLGLNVKLFEAIDGTDPASLVAKVVDSKAKALVICGYMDEFIRLRQAFARDGRYRGVYYTPTGPGLPEFYKRLKTLAEGVFSTSQWQLQINRKLPDSKAFFQTFDDAYGIKPSYFAATAYAAGQLLRDAILQVRTMDREEVRDALSQMDAQTIIGRYGVDSKGVQIKNFNIIVQVQGGRQEVVWPPGLIQKPPVFR
jgi:branched-chain amino acid transport system substrate-binding protein